MRTKCSRCGTEYIFPVAECDWCPGVVPAAVRPGFTFMAELPNGTRTIAFANRIFLCSHDGPPCTITALPNGGIKVEPIIP